MKKAVFIVLAITLVIIGASMSYANDGLTTITGVQTHINPGGLGDSLLYGYYNVRGNVNLFNIVNTQGTDGEKVRVIFRNAKNSKECLDFSVCLSKGDVWTAFLADNGTTAAICNTIDSDTLTSPTIAGCQPFKFDGSGGQTGVTADDCREGYFEIIGLSEIPNYDSNNATAAKNIPMVTDTDCRDWAPTDPAFDVPNVLMGNNSIISFGSLATYSYNATALADTSLQPITLTVGVEKTIPEAMATGRSGAQACAEADYIFMKSDLISPFDLLNVLGGETELIVTFPTRLACHNTANTTDMFGGDTDTTTPGIQYCTPVNIALWDDSENRLDITDFSPSVGRCLHFETNVISLGGSSIWSSTVASSLAVGTFQLGWVDIDLAAGVSSHSSTYATPALTGLPAIGYTTQSFAGGAASYLTPIVYKDTLLPL